jgi:hypothetical protein
MLFKTIWWTDCVVRQKLGLILSVPSMSYDNWNSKFTLHLLDFVNRPSNQNALLELLKLVCVTWSQSYDREYQRHGYPGVIWKQKYFSTLKKNALAYYNTGVVVVGKFQSRRIGSCSLNPAETFLPVSFQDRVRENVFGRPEADRPVDPSRPDISSSSGSFFKATNCT